MKPTPKLPPTQPDPAESFVLTLPDEPTAGNDWYLWAGVLALLVFVVFFPAIMGQQLWDDDHHVGLMNVLQSVHDLGRIWLFSGVTPQYYPMTFSTFWAEHHIWNDNTLGYHLDNMILHAASAILVWRLLRRLRLPGAWLAAAVWAIHPLQVESVAWMTERKNVLSGLFFFASIWFYLEYAALAPPPGKRRPGLSADGTTVVLGHRGLAYALSLLLLILGLLSKSVVSAMPAVMLIILWWKGRKLLDRRTWAPLIPFFLVGVAMAAITVYMELSLSANVRAQGPDWAISPVQRILIAARGLWFYAFKLVWPANLIFSYPRVFPSPQALGQAGYLLQWFYVIAALAALAALWIERKTLGRGPLAAVLFYCLTIFPALGFINVYPMRYSFVADHFQYLAGLGLIVLAVSALSRAVRRLAIPPTAMAVGAAALVGLLAVPAWMQAHIYATPIALWEDTLKKNPDSWMAANNLAIDKIKLGEQQQEDAATSRLQGQTDDANTDIQEAMDNFHQAEDLCNHAEALRPQDITTHTTLGLDYYLTGRFRDAEQQMLMAVQMDEAADPAHQLVAPYVDYVKLVERNHPGVDVRPWLDRALVLSRQTRVMADEVAGVHLTYGDYWFKQAGTAADAGKSQEEVSDLDKAFDELKEGLRTSRGDIGGLYDLGRAYERMGVIERLRADRARARGQMDQAAMYEDKSFRVDDANALRSFQAVLDHTPSHRHPGALVGIGEIYYHHLAVEHDSQQDVVHDLLLSLKFTQDAIAANPKVSSAVANLTTMSRRFMQEGLIAQSHEATWAELREKVEVLTTVGLSKESATEAGAAAHDALYVAAKDHPLRPDVQQLQSAIDDYLAASPMADPGKSAQRVQDAATNLLHDWHRRDPSQDAIADAITAALCYEGAVTADEHWAAAWLKLRDTAQTLATAAATHGDFPGLIQASKQAAFVLDQRRAATQPTTRPAAD